MTAVAVQPAIRKGSSSMRVFHDTWLVFRRSLGLTVRQPAWLIAGVMQPFVYLILFGPLLDSLSSVPGFPAGGAFNTFVPGLLVMTALFGSTFVGFGFISEMRSGVVERMRVTPMSRTAAVLGRTLRDVVVFMFQGLVLVVVSIPLGLRIDPAGLIVAFAAKRWVEPQLFNTSATDPLVFVAVILVLEAMALLAGWLPARRAMSVSPIEALRAE